MNKLQNYNYYISISVIIIIVFFFLNPLKNWVEGDIENAYFIYYTLVTANSNVPSVIDYPGNSSFSINSIYLKFISIFNENLEINLDEIINLKDPLKNLKNIFVYLKFLQLLYFIITGILLLILFQYFCKNKYISLLLVLLFILSPTFFDNLQRYRFDIESFIFFLISSVCLINATIYKKYNFIYVFLSGVFLCFALFSKIIVLPLLLIIPIVFYFKKNNSLKLTGHFKNFFLKDLIIIFIVINITFFIFHKINFYLFSNIVIFTNNLFYLLYYFFYKKFFELVEKKKQILFFITIVFGFLLGVFFMFSQALNLQKIYLVTSPISIYQNHFSGEGSLIENSLSSFERLRFNFFEILLFIFCIGISWKSYPQNTMINITLFIMYILFKFIFSLKYGIYMDIYPYFILLLIICLNLQFLKSLRINILIFLLCLNILFNFNFLSDNKFNNKIDDLLFCQVKDFTEKEFYSIKKENNFVKYYTPKFANYNFMKKLCYR